MASFSVPASGDAAEDAARLLQRLGYVVLALGAPCAEALSSRAIFLFFPIGMALLLVAAMLNPVKGVGGRLYQALWSPLGMAQPCAARLGRAFAGLDAVSDRRGGASLQAGGHRAGGHRRARLPARQYARGGPLSVSGGRRIGDAGDPGAGVRRPRGHGFLYAKRSSVAASRLSIMLWPAMAGLAARGRNGLARLLMILTAAFSFAIGAPIPAAALFVGVLTLSFAISDIKRTVFDLGDSGRRRSSSFRRWRRRFRRCWRDGSSMQNFRACRGLSPRWRARRKFSCTNRSGCSPAMAIDTSIRGIDTGLATRVGPPRRPLRDLV